MTFDCNYYNYHVALQGLQSYHVLLAVEQTVPFDGLNTDVTCTLKWRTRHFGRSNEGCTQMGRAYVLCWPL